MFRPRLAHLLVAAAIVAGAILFLLAAPRHRGGAMAAGSGSGELLTQVAHLSGGAAAAPPARETVEAASADALEVMVAARRLVRTGSLSVQVDRYAEAAEKAVAIAESHGGYLADAKASRDSQDRQRGTLTLRVEASAFDAAFRKLKSLGKVESASVDTQDVGRAYADLETRLTVKRDAQARLAQILRTKTGSLSDLVEAERELSRLVEEAERMEGERRFLERQVSLSTITIALFEPPTFLQEGAGAPLFEAFRAALPLLARSCAAMLYAGAAALPWVLVATLIWKLRRRARVRRLIRVAGAEG